MHDPIGIPACFTGEKPMDDPVGNKSGQSVVISVYRTKIAGHCRSITMTWCKNLLVHGLSIYVEGSSSKNQYSCKVELKPWYFWRKQGSKSFQVDGKRVEVFWDLKMAKLSGDSPEPLSDYYVAVVYEEEVVLLLGDLKNEAYRKTRSRPSLIDAILISKKEHIFGKKKFVTRAKFHEKGKFHEISIECSNNSNNNDNSDINFFGLADPEMAIKLDGHPVIHVKHLQWKFRGNESISINKVRVEVFWDVHDWLFSPGLSHAVFIFKPSTSLSSSPPPSSSSSSSLSQGTISKSVDSFGASSSSIEGNSLDGSPGFCLFLYAWKLE